ncbi:MULTISPECIES: YheC/YheD family endospore coat-associated protein [Paenibacillus]|uniref:YheC/YheD family endospore coat-associated protein n=1 Tax=Paenibacillus TaxID=44249 RepID=UPI0022B8EBFA|nr:YheC/YheD family protein [Paenibacillus caseinilyticus]MCZ8518368.1 YheC/YheD family protein [Paenibacillus caseinilyticus]
MDAFLQQKKERRPTMAILTHADEKRIFRGNRENFVDLIRKGEESGVLVYVMTTTDFKLSGGKAIGYTYHSAKKKWQREELPLPHVIYNRIPYRKFELIPEVQQVLQTCLRHGQIHFFNPSFFNKWTLFEWLNKSKETRSVIPATLRLSSGGEEIEKLLGTYPILYLKPIRGKAGKGIMKVSRSGTSNQSRMFELSIQEKTKSHISRYPTARQLWTELEPMVGTQDYIVQQGITLSHYKQRPFDLRVLVQKNGKGLWTVAGIGARLAGKMSITTHVPRGGSIDDPAKLLAYSFGTTTAKRILIRAKKTALTVAKRIEYASGHVLGEMSMDLGVDSDGHIWFFEANSKPMKFDEPPIRQKSLENLIQYCIHLSKIKRSAAAGESAASLNQLTGGRQPKRRRG